MIQILAHKSDRNGLKYLWITTLLVSLKLRPLIKIANKQYLTNSPILMINMDVYFQVIQNKRPYY